jgi:hypothetical protein
MQIKDWGGGQAYRVSLQRVGEAGLAEVDRDKSSITAKAAASRRTPKWAER